MTAAIPYDQDEPREPAGIRAFRFLCVLGMHIAALTVLLQLSPASPPTQLPAPMHVRIIEAAPPAQVQAEIPKPVITPPKPIPQSKRAVVPPTRTAPPAPVLAAKPEAPSSPASFAVAPQPASQPRQDASPSSAATPAVSATPARFDADYLQNPAPAYPPVSKRMREEGTVQLLVRVTANGEAERVQVKQGSGFTRLDEAAVKTVQQWRFVPARLGAETVAASVIVPIVFRLDS